MSLGAMQTHLYPLPLLPIQTYRHGNGPSDRKFYKDHFLQNMESLLISIHGVLLHLLQNGTTAGLHEHRLAAK